MFLKTTRAAVWIGFWPNNCRNIAGCTCVAAINAVGVKVEGHRAKASHRLRVGEHVSMVLPDLPRVGPVPENIPLEILFEDAELAAINKPPGMVVHPAKGHWEGTLTVRWRFISRI